MDSTAIKHWSSKTGCLMWLDDNYGNPEYEDAEPVHIDSKTNHQGWIVSQVWAIRLPSGEYLTGER